MASLEAVGQWMVVAQGVERRHSVWAGRVQIPGWTLAYLSTELQSISSCCVLDFFLIAFKRTIQILPSSFLFLIINYNCKIYKVIHIQQVATLSKKVIQSITNWLLEGYVFEPQLPTGFLQVQLHFDLIFAVFTASRFDFFSLNTRNKQTQYTSHVCFSWSK